MRINSSVAAAVILLGISSCASENEAELVIDRAYRAHGSAMLNNAILEFDFRGDRYVASRDGGVFSYERIYADSTGTVRDVVNNDEIFREINGSRAQIDDRTRRSIHTRVNSIIYFASLPHALRDPAVISRHLGVGTIRAATYDKIEITFREQGGGRDYKDRFLYWVNRESDLIDYFAYYYLTDETGSRLRKLVNPRDVRGFRAVDHVNYSASPDTLGSRIELFDRLLEVGAVDTVSLVKHDNVSLVPL